MGALSLWPLAIPGAFTHLVIQHMFIEHQLQSTLEQLRIGGGECGSANPNQSKST